MNCKEARQLISPYLDGVLEGKEYLQIQLHLETCSQCREDYRHLSQLSNMLRSMGKDIQPAPAGFKNAVMLAVRNETPAPIRTGIWSRLKAADWKIALPAIAAAVLLVFTAVNSLAWWGPESPPVAVQKQPGPILPSNPVEPEPITVQLPETPPADKPVAGSTEPTVVDDKTNTPPEETNLQVAGAPVLVSIENRNILSTMLVLSGKEEQKTWYEKVKSVSLPYKASIDKLGQQNKDGVTYNLFKLTVDRNHHPALINELCSLGTVISCTDDKQDISQTYTQALEKFLSLSNERGETKDTDRLKQLDQQISGLQQQLGDWKKKSASVTVVVWIQD